MENLRKPAKRWLAMQDLQGDMTAAIQRYVYGRSPSFLVLELAEGLCPYPLTDFF
jgi:hypothetical protein